MLGRLLLAVAVLLAVPASAQAAFEVRSFTVTPANLHAGSHPDVNVALGFTPWSAGSPPEHVRDLTLSLPPGLVGNPNATPRCAPARFAADDCAANTRVGTTSVNSAIPALVTSIRVTAQGDVYNLRPGPGEPARLGVVVRPPLGADKVFLVVRVALRPSDGGLDSILTGLPSTVHLLVDQEMWIESMSLTLFGRPAGASKPFMTMPTSCRPATARAVARSANGTVATRTAAPFTPTACGRLPFKPQLQASVSNDRLPALRTVITGPPDSANTATATVTLPEQLGVNVDVLQDVCTSAQQAAGRCPETARVGRAVARTPLLPPLSGSVYLAELPGQLLPGLRVFLSGTVSLSLAGTVDAFHSPLSTRFAGIPDVPLERFELTFDPGRALRATGDVCRGPLPRIGAQLTGHNGATARLSVPVTVTGCAEPVARLRVRGRFLRLRVAAARNGPGLDRVRLKLPKRLKAHPRRGRISPRAKLTRRGVLTVTADAARRVTATLRRGAFTGRLGKKRRGFVLTTVDASGRAVRQRLRARR